MGRICCPETSVANYQSTLSNIPEEWKTHLKRGGNLKLLTIADVGNAVWGA